MSDVFETGFGGDLTINAKTFPVVSWSGTFPATALEYTNSKVGNHPATLTTFTRANVSVVIDWAQADQPFQSSQGALVPGTPVTNVYCQLSATLNDGWLITSMVVVNATQNMERAGKIMTTLSLQINGGLITPPAGSSF